jgi:hypothetical protein
MQGLGEGPAGALVGTSEGRVCYVMRGKEPVPLRCFETRGLGSVECLAANDEIVVTGWADGSIRYARMDADIQAAKTEMEAATALLGLDGHSLG